LPGRFLKLIFFLRGVHRSRTFALMRTDVVESLPELAGSGAVPEDPGVERSLQNFLAAINAEESLFRCEVAGPERNDTSCSGDFSLRFSSDSMANNRQLHFALVEKLMELLNQAGSPDSMAMQICIGPASGSPSLTASAGLMVRLRLTARGSSGEQTMLRWGLGLAHVQQALLFTSRQLRQRVSKSAN
jgi:hypothetical protein